MKLSFNRRARVQAKEAGYTVVEIMMATSLFAIGVTGIMAMQVSTAEANIHAKNVATATALARSWQEKLTMDATLWGKGNPWASDANTFGLTSTRWIDAGLTGAWHLPANDLDADPTFGPGADARGAFVDHTASPEEAFFCTHIRLTPLVALEGSGLVRAEVRVFWQVGPVDWDGPYCTAANVVAVGASSIGSNPAAGSTFATVPSTATASQLQFVYKTSALRETPAY